VRIDGRSGGLVTTAPSAIALCQHLAEVHGRIERIGIRFTAGDDTDADGDGRLAWVRTPKAKRADLRAVLAEADSPKG
jgi:hypothetical protein